MSERLFFSQFAADPYFNMAFDEYLLERASKHPGSVLLRLYSWNPGALTFGRNQKLETAFNHDRRGDTAAIRRLTGGRALYHDPSELTYCIAINQSGTPPPALDPKGASLGDRIAKALVSFLKGQGVASDYVRRSARQHADPGFFHRAPCFASHARSEVVADGRKIVASAAYRTGSTVLQHGAIKTKGITSHPALSGLEERSANPSSHEPLTSAEFATAAEEFRTVMSRSFDVAFEYGMIPPEDFRAIKDRRENILQEPFSVRDKF